MQLSPNDLILLCEVAKVAARAAGDIINSFEGEEINVLPKDGGENIASCVVTEVDIKCQKIIINTLSETFSTFDLGLLAEEGTQDLSRFEKDYFWCIDPLDGTLAFSEGIDGYSVSIALVSKSGEPFIGVVYNPRTHDLYSSIKGMRAFKNNSPLIIKNKTENLTLFYDQSYTKDKSFEQHIELLKIEIKALGLKNLILKPLGGAVMNAIGTIEDSPALYYKFPKQPQGGGSLWDFAASSIIQKEAGGYNSNFYNKPIKLNQSDSTFMNSEGVIFASSYKLLQLISPLIKNTHQK